MKWFCRHDWTEWSGMVNPYGPYRQQWRKCKKCGLLKYRTVGYAGGVSSSVVNALFKSNKETNNE